MQNTIVRSLNVMSVFHSDLTIVNVKKDLYRSISNPDYVRKLHFFPERWVKTEVPMIPLSRSLVACVDADSDGVV